MRLASPPGGAADRGLSAVRPRLRTLAAAGAVALLALALPSAGRADIINVGSDLAGKANLIEAHGADSAFWNVTLPGRPQGAAMPAPGEVIALRLKGTALSNRGAPRPLVQFHFQVIRPQGDGTYRVILSSNPFDVPVDVNPDTISTYHTAGPFCVNAGDYITFNDEGGWDPNFYPSGTPFEVFTSAPASTTAFYTKDNGTNVGMTLAPSNPRAFGGAGALHQGQEVLLQSVLATRYDATPVCGGLKGRDFRGMIFRLTTIRMRSGVGKLRLACPPNTIDFCAGNVVITTVQNGAPVLLAQATYNLRAATATNVKIKLTRQGAALLKKKKSLRATATANAHDRIGASKVTSATVTIR
jgi:hypothetical protein